MSIPLDPPGTAAVALQPCTQVIRPDEGKTLSVYGDSAQVKLSGEQTNGSMSVALCTTPPGGGPPPCRQLIIITPSAFERFFARSAEIFTEAGEGGTPDLARLLAISDEYRIEFVPPLGIPH